MALFGVLLSSSKPSSWLLWCFWFVALPFDFFFFKAQLVAVKCGRGNSFVTWWLNLRGLVTLGCDLHRYFSRAVSSFNPLRWDWKARGGGTGGGGEGEMPFPQVRQGWDKIVWPWKVRLSCELLWEHFKVVALPLPLPEPGGHLSQIFSVKSLEGS